MMVLFQKATKFYRVFFSFEKVSLLIKEATSVLNLTELNIFKEKNNKKVQLLFGKASLGSLV